MDVLQSISIRDPMSAREPGDEIETITITEVEESRLPTPTAEVRVEPGTIPMPEAPAAREGMYPGRPAMVIDPEKSYTATFKTEKGDIVVELYADKVPNTVNNFVFLAREGFYDDTTFHRVIEDFMAQGGDPTGTGRGGPGYTFADEFDDSLTHSGPGILSMANAGANTNGSQFFITFTETPWLDGAHAVFGKVVEGLDVLQSISIRDPQTASEPGDLIETIVIDEK
jgi:cyclophilin family peptidyl-prolyl cis-trans isomerase